MSFDLQGEDKKTELLPTESETTENSPCLVVGIGASSGGQEALEQLFTAMPSDCGLAYVVTMQLPPDAPPFLAEMLGRCTAMPVVTAEDGIPCRPDRVHVIPAGQMISLSGGRLRLKTPTDLRGTFHPVDHFFLSLAAAAGEDAVAVVLSGPGTDGAEGVKAIHEAGGTVIVQDPDSARHPAMPRSAIATGAADLVLPAQELATKLAEVARGTCPLSPRHCRTSTFAADLDAVLALVKNRTGRDFSSYKRNTLVRRIERRMAINDVAGMQKYIALLESSEQETRALGQEILIGVTSFFRDPEAFAVLRREVFPRLFAHRDPELPVRIWHACCATGEEVYSTAILIREYLAEQRLEARVQIFATDVDETAIAIARSGLYPDEIAAQLDEERLKAFFTRVDGRWQVTKSLREMVVFAHHNLIKDPPFSRLDLLVCRNFLIYLTPDMQQRLFALFHQALKPQGVLFLGTAETTGHHSDLFAPIDKKWKLFERLEGVRRPDLLLPFTAPACRFPRSEFAPRPVIAAEQTPGGLAEKLLVERYAPPCVVVNENCEVVHVSTRAGRFLEVPVGEPTRDLLKMAREELRPVLRAAIYKCFGEQKPVTFRGVTLTMEGSEEAVNVLVEPLDAPPPAPRLAMVVLEPVLPAAAPLPPTGAAADGDDATREALTRQLEEQLRLAREQLQAVTEQLETSHEGFMSANEELMSINEEYQSANEELQSTNEELETSKEELQALNEELATVNAELLSKVEELDRANNDMENLFRSSGVAAVFLDRELTIRRFSPAMAEIFNLIPADLGRPFRHFSGAIDWNGLPEDARSVLASLDPVEREVATLGGGNHFLMRVLPYRTAEDKIDGVVVTLIDITGRRRAENKVRSVALFPEENPAPVLRIKGDGTVLFANRAAAAELLPQWQCAVDSAVPEFVRREVSATLAGDGHRTLEIRCGERELSFVLVPIADRGYVNFYGRDVTERLRAMAALRESEERLRLFIEHAPAALAMFDREMRCLSVSRRWLSDYGLGGRDLIGQSLYDVIPEIGPAWREVHRRGLAGEVVKAEGDRFERADGSMQWLRWEVRPWRDDAGEVGGIVIFTEDITESKRAEAALRESELRYRTVGETIPYGIWQTDAAGACTYVSDSFLEMTGMSWPELQKFGWLHLLPEEDRQPTQEHWLRCVRTGEDFQREHRFRAIDGTTRFVLAIGRPVRNDRDEIAAWVGINLDITERKRAEESLRKNKERLKRAQEIAHLGSWEFDLVANQLTWSDEVYRIFGLQPQEFAATYEAFLEAVHPEDRSAVNEAYADSLREGRDSYEIEHRVVRKATGEICYVHEKCEHFRDEAGRIIRSVGMVHDITARKQAEEALRQSEKKFRSIIENLPLGMYMYELDDAGALRLTGSNPAADRIVGIDNRRHHGRRIEEAFPALASTVVPDRFRAIASEGGIWHDEEMTYRDNRIEGTFEVHSFQFASGKMATFFQDITGRKQSEEALQRSYQRRNLLAETAGRLLASDSPQQVVEELCQKVMAFLDCQTFFNYVADEASGRLHLNACVGIPDEEKKKIEWLDYGSAVCGCAARDGCRIVAEEIPNTPDPRTELVKSYGIRAYACHPLTVQGRVLGTLSFGTRTRNRFSEDDLSLMKAVADQVAIAMERKQSEETLRQAKETAEAATRAKGQFLANMSHELRTPMTGVLGMLELALQGELSAEQRGYLETVQKSAEALLRILNDILDFSRIEARGVILVEEPFDLHASLYGAVELFSLEAQRKGLDLELEIAPATPRLILGDEGRVRQILINLLGNAVKFTGEGKVALQVAAGDDGREISFTVADTGIGIPDEQQPLIFQPFSQVDASHTRRFGGTGLGLAISREVIERMEGTISFTSRSGAGTTFVVTLPLRQAAAAAPAATPTAAAPLPSAAETDKPRLLVAEDDPIIRKLLEFILQRGGFVFDFAVNGEEAVGMWSERDYDLILMDMQMPRMDGFEAARAIRDREAAQGGHIPIVALTAHAYPEDEQKCLAAGMDAYLAKPINIQQLSTLVGDLLGDRETG